MCPEERNRRNIQRAALSYRMFLRPLPPIEELLVLGEEMEARDNERRALLTPEELVMHDRVMEFLLNPTYPAAE